MESFIVYIITLPTIIFLVDEATYFKWIESDIDRVMG